MMMRGMQPTQPKTVIRVSKKGDSQSKAAKRFIVDAGGSSLGQHDGYKKAVRKYIETNQGNPSRITGVFAKDQYNALFRAIVWHGDAEMVSILLGAGFQVNEMCNLKYESTALMCAAEKGKLDIVQLLLSRGANVLLTDKDGKTAEQLATENNQSVVADLLKQKREELTEVKKAPTRADDLAAVGVGDAKVNPSFCCPLSGRVMQQPVTVSTGATYDRTSLFNAFLQAGNPESIKCFVKPGKMILRKELENGMNIVINALIKQYVHTEIMSAEIAQGGPEVKEVKNENAVLPSQAGLFASSVASSSNAAADLSSELVGPSVPPVAITWSDEQMNAAGKSCRTM